MNTPWGASQTETAMADGLVLVTTASHGGIKVSPSRWLELTTTFPYLQSWAGAGWLEEDCDVAWAMLRWPEAFDDNAVYHAVEQVKATAMRELVGPWANALVWLQTTPAGQAVQARHDAYYEQIKDQWHAGGGRSRRDGGWDSFMHRPRDGKRKVVTFLRYPMKAWYTDEEIRGCPQEDM